MTSSRSSKVTTLAVLCVLALSVAAPAAAVSVGTVDAPSEAEAGTQVSASFTLENLYQEPQWESWTLQGETALENVTWTVTFIDQTGAETDVQSYDGQELDGVQVSTDQDIDAVRVEVVGEAPRPEEFTYPEKERFLMAELTQVREGGSQNEIGAWGAHHYTTGSGEDPGSQQARQAMSSAEAAIADAEAAGADTSDANTSIQNAREFYRLGQFSNAIEQANRAEEQANQAGESAESAQLLMYGGLAVVVLALLGGGIWYYRQQQDTYDKLG